MCSLPNRIIGSLLLICLSACVDVIHLAPRTPPLARMPAVALPREPPASGMGRLVVDVEGESLPVSVFASDTPRNSLAAHERELRCDTPCVQDLPLGRYDVYFHNPASDNGYDDKVSVEVVRALTVLREAPGKRRSAPTIDLLPDLLTAIGFVLTTAMVQVDVHRGVHLEEPSIFSLGGAMMIYGLATRQLVTHEQAGASTRFVLPLTAGEAGDVTRRADSARALGLGSLPFRDIHGGMW